MNLVTIALFSFLFLGFAVVITTVGLSMFGAELPRAVLLAQSFGSLFAASMAFEPVCRLLKLEHLPNCLACGARAYIVTAGGSTYLCSNCHTAMEKVGANQFAVRISESSTVRLTLKQPTILGRWRLEEWAGAGTHEAGLTPSEKISS